MKSAKSQRKVNVDMYRWLVGNLRLWSVQGTASSAPLVGIKAYTAKQQGKIVSFTRII